MPCLEEGKNGGTDAIFHEIPCMKLLMNRYDLQYKMVGPTYRTDGFGFDPLSSTISQGTSSLTFYEFSGLFIVVGSTTIFGVICSETPILSKLTNMTRRFTDKYCCKTTKVGIKVDGKMSNGACIEVVEIPWINEADVVQDAGREIRGMSSPT
ncbi:hypothetical protein Salat_2632100 [Sesamum alatum]|uniref:Uncharacterized protein n=1 Tax=Sesamum alatum TaxID=300844 RepID=A0AAE2CAP5_9LAMI|nr:hypothetical protein Salat_2632100 [Sesamum alatum]